MAVTKGGLDAGAGTARQARVVVGHAAGKEPEQVLRLLVVRGGARGL